MIAVLADQCINRDVRDALRTLSIIDLTYAGDIGLATAPDPEIFEYARAQKLVLFTSDHGFGDVRTFDPKLTAGIVIVYVENFGRESLIHECKKFFESHTSKSLRNRGFIIEPGRVRTYGSG